MAFPLSLLTDALVPDVLRFLRVNGGPPIIDG